MVATDTRSAPVQSVSAFLEETSDWAAASGAFASVTARMLRIDVDGGVWLKPGAAVAYRGELSFDRLPTLGARSFRDAMLREAAPLVRAHGKGLLYCASHGAHVRIVRLEGDAIVVAWPDLLAIEDTVTIESSLVAHGVGIAAGGLVVARLSGYGAFAVSTHGRPLTLPVAPGEPVSTDPHATLAWSVDLTPQLKTDLSWRSAFGHGGHEPVQMFFEGSGFVVVQPFENERRFRTRGNPLKKIATLVGA